MFGDFDLVQYEAWSKLVWDEICNHSPFAEGGSVVPNAYIPVTGGRGSGSGRDSKMTKTEGRHICSDP